MKSLVLLSALLTLATQAHAQFSALDILNEGFDPAAKLELEKPFPFFESCEQMPARVLGRDPLTQRVRPITIEIYRPRENAINKRVLVVPPTGGVNQLDRDYSRMLCSHGIEAWVITEWEPGQIDHVHSVAIESHDVVSRKALAAIRQVVSRMKAPVGILGTSAGAIAASVALAVEPKLTAGVLIAGGAGLPEIIAKSQGEVMRELRQRRLQAYRWTPSDYQRALEQVIRLDVTEFAGSYSGKRIGTVVALRDRTVPARNQVLLERITGATRIAEFDDDHVSAIVSNFIMSSWRVVQFFERNL